MSKIADLKERLEAKRAEREKLERQAEADGQLWTIQIAYKADSCFALIEHGRISEDSADIFRAQNPDAGMFLDPTIILGDKLHVRQQACKLANCDEFLIRVVGVPKRQQITPGVVRV